MQLNNNERGDGGDADALASEDAGSSIFVFMQQRYRSSRTKKLAAIDPWKLRPTGCR